MTRYRRDPDLGGTRRLLDGRLPADMPTTDPRAPRATGRRTGRTLIGVAAVIVALAVLAIVIGDLGELQGWW